VDGISDTFAVPLHSCVASNVDIVSYDPTSASQQRVGTVVFSHADKPTGTHVTSTFDETYNTGGSHDVSLGDFLKRPVEIYSTQVALGANLSINLNPWSAFLDDALVRRRIEGFKHIRGHLRVRAMITGNPFLFGRIIMAYEPRYDRSVLSRANTLSEAYRMQLSQLPHIFLDPTKGEGGEMTLPFFCPENWLDLTNSTAVSDMGTLTFNTFNTLKHANSTSGECLFRVYAWMEDAEICTPTANSYGTWVGQSAIEQITPVAAPVCASTMFLGLLYYWNWLKSRNQDDQRSTATIEAQSEFAEHPISATASAIERASGALAHVPMFAPYAKATELASSVAGKVAKAFGFSRPAVLQNIAPYREYEAGSLAVSNAHETVMPIAMDVKRELTVDPRTVGLPPVDEMAIAHVVGKESYFHTALWNDSDNANSSLVQINVTPGQFETDSTVLPNRSGLTPAAYISQMFRYWRGTIIYRFQIVASGMHRGKLRVTYDPVISPATGDFNQQYSRVIDLETDRDFEVPVQWHAREPWLKCETLDIGSTNFNKGVSPITLPAFHNGRLTLSVVNPLTSPDPDLAQDVEINVFMRMGPDAEFIVPSDTFALQPFSIRSSNGVVEPQSAMEADGLPQDNNPEGGEPMAPIGDTTETHTDKSSLIYFGESVPSLRTLLRRYRYRTSSSVGTYTWHLRPNISTTNFALQEAIMMMYAGWRGSMRFKSLGYESDSTLFVMNGNPNGNAFNLTAGESGSVANRGSLEFEIPYYYNKRFSHTRTSPFFAANTDTDNDDPNEHGYQLRMYGASNDSLHWHAVGEDFTCFFFLNIPLLFNNV
jgi:hypothetical protein